MTTHFRKAWSRSRHTSWIPLLVLLRALWAPLESFAQLPATISFLSHRATLRAGSSQVVAFRTEKPATSKRFFSFKTDENLVRVLMPPTQLAGESIGYLRLVGTRAGMAMIDVDGTPLPLTIVASRGTMESATIEIVTPVRGAVVWGTFAVGVEQFDPDAFGANLPIVLRLPNGKELQPNEPTEAMPGPSRRLFFEVDAAQLSEGANEFTAVVKDADGRERTSRPLRVVRGKNAPIAEGECREHIATVHPTKAGEGTVKLVDDKNYPGGQVVSNASENPAWSLPVAIKDEGEYQMFVTARGDAGGGALPTIGLVLDAENNPITTARLASTAWHRVAVGHPVRLKEGEHTLTVRFRNDFSRGQNNDRNLALAHYELARVDESAAESAPLSVTFDSALDGRSVTGGVDLAASCRLKKGGPPPLVQLFVNDRVVAEARAAHPTFHISANAFRSGKNVLHLVATAASGERARSVSEVVSAPADWHPAAHDDLPVLRFSVEDHAWNRELAALIPPAKHEAFFATNGEASLALPDSLEGEYTLFIAARGDEFEGPPELSVELKQPSGAIAQLGRLSVKKDAGEIRAGVLQFQKGAKRLKLAFVNDRYEAGVGDRNLILRGVRLEPTQTVPDQQPPIAKILYPAPGQLIGKADAVVAEVGDDRAVMSVDLRIDGKPQLLNQATDKGFGPVVLPLLARDLPAGEHRLEAEVRDAAGNVALSPVITFRVAAAGEKVDGPYQHALLLLNRFGYGPEPRELGDLLTRGPRAWLSSRIHENADTATEQNLATQLDLAFPNETDRNQVVRRAFKHLLATANPVRARFVMWAENHFSTWIDKTGAAAKADEHRRFVEVGPAPFFDLLLASSTSPAMLTYLDQRNSVADKLNENYAREIMELHTLGVKGGYTQKDVTTLADLLTGWSVAEEADEEGSGTLKPDFRFDSLASSGRFCRVLGMEFPGVDKDQRFDRIRTALEMLTAHPSCAEFVCRRLAEHYVSDPAPERMVTDLAKIFRETGGDMREVLLAMAEHPQFFLAKPKVASPIDYAVRAGRMARLENADVVRDFTSASGMGMFDRATPDGYPQGDEDFVGSNALLQRWRFAQKMQSERLIPASWRPGQDEQTPEAMQRMIDLVAIRLTGNLLSESTSAAALRLLEDAPAKPESRLALLTAFIGQSPEASLR